tara:strand:+ start:2400 stop:2714 length:315 start_codon:yes stop_codon:yes gene_type:complete
MKKIIFLIFVLSILNGCAEYSSVLGPSYTMAKTGKVASAGNSIAASYGFKKVTGESPETIANTFFSESENLRECQTIHSSNLNKIFFTTLDEIDCFRDPFSILR